MLCPAGFFIDSLSRLNFRFLLNPSTAPSPHSHGSFTPSHINRHTLHDSKALLNAISPFYFQVIASVLFLLLISSETAYIQDNEHHIVNSALLHALYLFSLSLISRHAGV
ncbi:hypothetical protein AX16_000045 [Volvariella volvacea WC 439]|nr:hypothetical protein AX16_000045 [Volvariella volvacea WC 439]